MTDIETEIKTRGLKFIYAARIPEDRHSQVRWVVLARDNHNYYNIYLRYTNGQYGLPMPIPVSKAKEWIKRFTNDFSR